MSARAATQRTIPGWFIRTGSGLVLPVALAVFWQSAVNLDWIDGDQWSSPGQVGHAFAMQVQNPQFWLDLRASLLRDAEGTLLGILIGLPAGVALGLSATVRNYISPSLDANKAVPIFTWVPLISVWVGSGEAGKVTFIALAASLPVLFSSAEGVFSLAEPHRELGRFLRLDWFTTLQRIIIPGASPGILRGVHLAFLYGWLATIGAEYLFEAGGGIGTNIMGARELFRLDLVAVDMIAIGLAGIVLDLGAGFGERYLLRWLPTAAS